MSAEDTVPPRFRSFAVGIIVRLRAMQGVRHEYLWHRRGIFLLAPDTGFPAAPGEKAREALMSLRAGESSSQHEIRISDAQLQANESVALALIIRALVETIIREPVTQVGLNREMLDLAFWQAAKHGLEGNQLDSETGDSIPSDQLVRVLLGHIRGALDGNGDVELVKAATDRLLTRGNGARRQRESMARGGIGRVISDAASAFTA